MSVVDGSVVTEAASPDRPFAPAGPGTSLPQRRAPVCRSQHLRKAGLPARRKTANPRLRRRLPVITKRNYLATTCSTPEGVGLGTPRKARSASPLPGREVPWSACLAGTAGEMSTFRYCRGEASYRPLHDGFCEARLNFLRNGFATACYAERQPRRPDRASKVYASLVPSL